MVIPERCLSANPTPPGSSRDRRHFLEESVSSLALIMASHCQPLTVRLSESPWGRVGCGKGGLMAEWPTVTLTLLNVLVITGIFHSTTSWMTHMILMRTAGSSTREEESLLERVVDIIFYILEMGPLTAPILELKVVPIPITSRTGTGSRGANGLLVEVGES